MEEMRKIVRGNKKGDSRFIKDKKGAAIWDTFLVVVVALLIILLLLFLIFHNTIVDWIRNLPGYKYDEKDRVVDELPRDIEIQMNYYKVARVVDGVYIKFCTNGDCNKLRDSKLILEGSEIDGQIRVSQKGLFDVDRFDIDDIIGYVKKGRAWLGRGVIEGYGDLYFEVKDDLPSHVDLLNLDNSIFISGIFYKKDGLIPSEENHYLERFVEDREEIEESSEDMSNYFSEIKSQKTQTVSSMHSVLNLRDPDFIKENPRIYIKTDWYGLKKPIENSGSQTGFDSGGEDLVYIQYASAYGHVWVRFSDDDKLSRDDVSPWIRMDYWNKYKSFARAPRGYIAVIFEDDTRRQ